MSRPSRYGSALLEMAIGANLAAEVENGDSEDGD